MKEISPDTGGQQKLGAQQDCLDLIIAETNRTDAKLASNDELNQNFLNQLNSKLAIGSPQTSMLSLELSNKCLNEDKMEKDLETLNSLHDIIDNDPNQNQNQGRNEIKGDNGVDVIKLIVSAAQHGDIQALKGYFEASKENPNPLSSNVTDSEGVTLVHWAALNNKLATIKYLVSIGANPDTPAGDMNATPLLWAVRYGLVYVADWLIREAKADITIVDKNGIGILLASVFSNNVMMVIYVIWTLNDNNYNGYANKNFGLEGIDSTDPTGRTALHWAAYQGDFLTVDVLLMAGAKPDLIDADGFTPLHWSLVNGNKFVTISLMDAKCNVNAKTGSGKSCWDIAADMNGSTAWASILKDSGRNVVTGEKLKPLLTEDWANFFISILPFITLPLALSILTLEKSVFLKVFLVILMLVSQQILLKILLIPCLNKGKFSFMRTPFFAGIFLSTSYWCIVTWLFKLLRETFHSKMVENFLFFFSAVGTVVFALKAMTMDPGYIPKEMEPTEISASIFELLKLRKFDSNHFCIHSNIRRPIRSKYSKEKRLNIARFDHYCPWVNNNIGVRNHKIFFAFALCLEIAACSWLNLALEYFDEIDLPNELERICDVYFEDICKGSINSKFIFYLFWWVLLQLIWLTVLLLVQIVQISKGATTYEFSHQHKLLESANPFSSVPADEMTIVHDSIDDVDTDTDTNTDMEIIFTDSSIPNTLQNKIVSISFAFISKIFTSRACRMIGLDQMVVVTNDLMHKKKLEHKKFSYNFGFFRNWLDFLFLCRIGDSYSFRTLTALPSKGENNLNGVLVDYYRLYNTPESV
jgi:palmitoyltransferase